MLNKHDKLTPSEFSKNLWTDCADAITGRFSAPAWIIGWAFAAWIAAHNIDLALLLLISAIIFASYKQAQRERSVIIALERKIENRELREIATNKLWELRQAGSHLRNMANQVRYQPDYEKWKTEYEQWRIDILREADVVDPNLARWNHTVNVMDMSKMPLLTSSYSEEEFTVEYMIICENLNRIEEYLKRELFIKQDSYFK